MEYRQIVFIGQTKPNEQSTQTCAGDVWSFGFLHMTRQ